MSFQLLTLLTVINLFNYLDRYLVAALLPLLEQHYSLTHVEGGFLVSSFVCGYVVAAPVAGWLSARLSKPKFALAGVLIFAVSTFICAIAPNYWIFILARIGIGIGEGIFSTITPTIISEKISDQTKLTRALALFFCAIPVGAALGYILGGVAGAHLGWHWAFIIAGIGSAISGLSLLKLNKKSEASDVHGEGISFVHAAKEIWRSFPLRICILGYALHTFALQGIAAFVGSYSSGVLGFDPNSSAQIFGVILVATGFAGTFAGGFIAPKWHILAGSKESLKAQQKFISDSALLAAVLIFIAFCVPPNLFFYVTAAAEFVAFATVAPVNSILLIEAPVILRPAVQGITILVINLLGSLLGPTVVGYFADNYGLSIAMHVTAVSMIFAGFVWRMVLRR